MKVSRLCPCRIAALALPLFAVAMVLAASPVRGQGGMPGVRHSAPTTRVGGKATRVDLDFTLPPGFQLLRHPRVRVVDAKDRLMELLPTEISQRQPAGKGHRDLHSSNYFPGVYRVRAEFDYIDRLGKRGTAVSPWTTFTVPGR